MRRQPGSALDREDTPVGVEVTHERQQQHASQRGQPHPVETAQRHAHAVEAGHISQASAGGQFHQGGRGQQHGQHPSTAMQIVA
jgi:hypothetical protein